MNKDEFEALLTRVGREQRANNGEPVDAFSCSHDEAALMERLRHGGCVRVRRAQKLMDGTIFHGVALTPKGNAAIGGRR